MDTVEIAVVAGGAAAVLFLPRFFFGGREAVNAETRAGGAQEIDITVRGGYSPDRVVVRAGSPVRLNFYRDETASCSESVVFGDFRMRGDCRPTRRRRSSSRRSGRASSPGRAA